MIENLLESIIKKSNLTKCKNDYSLSKERKYLKKLLDQVLHTWTSWCDWILLLKQSYPLIRHVIKCFKNMNNCWKKFVRHVK